MTGVSGSPNNINFQLALPDPVLWNGKFLFLGNDGFAGSIQVDVTSGFPYATAATDTGHQSASSLDGSWALNNQLEQDDFGYRGVHFSALVNEDLTKSYYANTAAQLRIISADARTADARRWSRPSSFPRTSTGSSPALRPLGN